MKTFHVIKTPTTEHKISQDAPLASQHIIWITKQPEEFREWMYQQYLHHFDPPRIQQV